MNAEDNDTEDGESLGSFISKKIKLVGRTYKDNRGPLDVPRFLTGREDVSRGDRQGLSDSNHYPHVNGFLRLVACILRDPSQVQWNWNCDGDKSDSTRGIFGATYWRFQCRRRRGRYIAGLSVLVYLPTAWRIQEPRSQILYR